MDLNGYYNDSAVITTDKRILAFDRYHENGVLIVNLADVTDSKVKRMYGNAVLRVYCGEKKIDLFRFTYSIASLADGVAMFYQKIAEGGDPETEKVMVEATLRRCAHSAPNAAGLFQAPAPSA